VLTDADRRDIARADELAATASLAALRYATGEDELLNALVSFWGDARAALAAVTAIIKRLDISA